MGKEIINCAECGKPFEREFMEIDGRKFGLRRCQACFDGEKRDVIESRKKSVSAELEKEWLKIGSPEYRNTNPLHPGLNPVALALAVNWSAARAIRGMGLVGKTGHGKTRCLFLALKAAHFAGRKVWAISHSKFAKTVGDAFSGEGEKRNSAKADLSRLRLVDVLLIDDLGKAPSTERVDAELWDLIEDRTSFGRPILWTANGGGQWLIDRLGVDRGESAVRRLAEFCEVVAL